MCIRDSFEPFQHWELNEPLSGEAIKEINMADIATVLYEKHLKFDPNDPRWIDRDRFILSNGHGSMLLYACLYLAGYQDINLDDI